MGDNDWKRKANATVSCGVGSKTSNVAQNMLITKAYASLYLSNPRVFKWAGMAAYASDMVGLGIASGKAADVFMDSVVASTLGTRDPNRLNATNLDNMLIEGNKAVFRDIYWQHLVYRDAGIEELIKLIKEVPGPRTDLLVDGWSTIAKGDKTGVQGLIWAGNELLLKYEQMITLQPVYDRYPALSSMLSVVMISPLPMHLAPFASYQPGREIGQFAARWRWIQEVLLPEWKRLESSSMSSEVRLIYMGKFPKSAVCFAE